MTLLSRLRHLGRFLRHRGAVETELSEELEAYVGLTAAEYERSGLAPAAARRRALAEMGGLEAVKESVREVRTGRLLEDLGRDLQFGWRSLRRSPAFTVAALATLAVGIGGTTAMFSVLNGALLRPVPGVVEPGRLVSLFGTRPTGELLQFGYPAYLDYRAGWHSVSGLAAHRTISVAVGTAPAALVAGDLVTSNYFELLGVAAESGRLFGPADDGPQGNPVVVLSEVLWRRNYGADPGMIGRTIRVNGQPFTVVGIVPRGFRGVTTGSTALLWMPMSAVRVAIPHLSADILTDRSAGWLAVFGRLQADVAVTTARSEAVAVARRLAATWPVTDSGRSAAVANPVGLDPDDRSDLAGVLGLLLGAVALLLVVGCANVAGLLMARNARRSRELAARLALGADRARLVRQLVTESALLVVPATLLGLLLARWLGGAILSFGPTTSLLGEISLPFDFRVGGFVAAAMVLTTVALSAAPARRARRLDPARALKQGDAELAGRPRLQRFLVAGQLATAFVLLLTAGLLAVTLRQILAAPIGFETDHVALVSVDLGLAGIPPDRGLDVYRAIAERLGRIPGVASVTYAKTIPPNAWSDRISIFQPGAEPPREILRAREMELGLRVYADPIGPGFFAAMGIGLEGGREFTQDDRAGRPLVAVVNQRLAERLWPGQSPLGRQIAWPRTEGPVRPPLTVVGVARDAKYGSLLAAPPPVLYFPMHQDYDARATFAVRTRGRPTAMIDPLVRALAEVAPEVPVSRATTMERLVDESVWLQRTTAVWLEAFAAIAIVLAGIGLYGLTAQSMAIRTRELSIRIALGAAPRRVVSELVREGLTLAGLGLAAGLPLGLAATELARRTVVGLPPVGAPLVAAAGLFLTVAILAACYLPARRALRLDPVDALRSD